MNSKKLYTLNISKTGNDNDMTQNMSVTSNNPGDITDILRKFDALEADGAPVEPAVSMEPEVSLAPAPKMGGCGMEPESVEEETGELANAPRPLTMKNLLDLVDTGHTQTAPNRITNNQGDNPLITAEDQLAEQLARDWKKEKIQHIFEGFSVKNAQRAMLKGQAEYWDGANRFAIEKDQDSYKVFPVVENEVRRDLPIFALRGEPVMEQEELLDTPVARTLARTIVHNRTDLLTKYGLSNMVSAINQVAEFVGDVEEIGSSDRHIFLGYVEDILAREYPDKVDEGQKNTSYAGALPGVSNATYERIIAAAEAAHEKGRKGEVMRILQDAKSALWSMEDFKREPDPKVKKRHVKLAKLYKARVEQINEDELTNPFELFSDHQDFEEANAAISDAVKSGDIDQVMDATLKYKHVGARDTASMEAIHAAMENNDTQIDEVGHRSPNSPKNAAWRKKVGLPPLKIKPKKGPAASKATPKATPKAKETPVKDPAIARNQKARASHWSKTGVSPETIKWMRDNNMLESLNTLSGHKEDVQQVYESPQGGTRSGSRTSTFTVNNPNYNHGVDDPNLEEIEVKATWSFSPGQQQTRDQPEYDDEFEIEAIVDAKTGEEINDPNNKIHDQIMDEITDTHYHSGGWDDNEEERHQSFQRDEGVADEGNTAAMKSKSNQGIKFKGKMVNTDSLEVDRDGLSYGEYTDGTRMSDDDLADFSDENRELVSAMKYDRSAGEYYDARSSRVETEEGTMEDWITQPGQDRDRPAHLRKREHEAGLPSDNVSNKFRVPGDPNVPAAQRQIEPGDELDDIMKLSGLRRPR